MYARRKSIPLLLLRIFLLLLPDIGGLRFDYAVKDPIVPAKWQSRPDYTIF